MCNGISERKGHSISYYAFRENTVWWMAIHEKKECVHVSMEDGTIAIYSKSGMENERIITLFPYRDMVQSMKGYNRDNTG